MAPRLRALSILLALLAAFSAVTLAGCLGDGGEDVDQVIADTFNGEKRIKSGNLSLDLSASLEGVQQLSGPITVTMKGPFESLDKDDFPKLDLDLVASAGGQRFQAGAVSTGDKGYFSFQGTDYVVPDAQFERIKREVQRAQRESENSRQPTLGALGIHPREWLRNPTDEGNEDVGGTETVHIKADVDLAKLLDDVDDLLKRAGQLGLSEEQRRQLPETIPPTVKRQIADAVKEAKVDLFTGKDDKILRRLELRLKFEVPEAARAQVQGLRSGDIEFSIEIADVNKPQTIKAPEKARPLRELQRQLNDLGNLGGGTSGGGSGSGGSGSQGGAQGPDIGGGPSSDSAGTQRYLRCVEQAKKASELRKCAELLR